MAWLSENWPYLLVLVGVLLLMRLGVMGCGMGGRHGHADASAEVTAATDPRVRPVRPVPVKTHCESIMRKPNLTSLLLLGLMWVSMTAWAEPQIRIERNQDEFRIDASLRVDAHHHIAWQVLTDYNNLARFVPGMLTSQLLSGPGEPLLLKQTGQSGFLLFKLPIEVVVRITETPLESIRFEAVGGSFKSKQGEWRIERREVATLLIYRASIAPGFWVPPRIGAAVISQDVRNKLLGVAREMQRRAIAEISANPGQVPQQGSF